MLRNRVRLYLLAACGVLFLPTGALAQSAIAGTVRDATGAVLPGTTVEARSPALIEQARVAVSDANGQYRIIELRPGTYRVTFTLPGFQTVVREDLVLVANATVPLNAQMRVGGVEETVTVTGESPVVDVQTSSRRDVISRDSLDLLPTGRNYMWMAATIPATSNAGFDVGGSATIWSGGALTVHGSQNSDARTLIDGLMVDGLMGSGQCACIYDNEMQTEEIVVNVSSGAAEHQLSGVIIDRIPRSGGNNFSGTQLVNGSWNSLEGENGDQELFDRGYTVPAELYRQYDVNYSLGGPIVRDRLWFYFSGRNWSYDTYPANASNPDGSRYTSISYLQAYPIRFTSQVTSRDKVTAYFNWSERTKPNFQDPNPGRTPEAIAAQKTPAEYITQVKWTSTVSPKLLLEAGYNLTHHNIVYHYKAEPFLTSPTCFTAFNQCAPGTNYGSVARRDTQLGFDSVAPFPGAGAGAGPEHRLSLSNVANISMTYVSGAHALKAGFQNRWGPLTHTKAVNGDLGQLYQNGVPFAVTVLNTPVNTEIRLNADMGMYIQDTWTVGKWTVSPGLRWDHFKSSIPAQIKPAGRFVGEQRFDPLDNVPNWNNVSPRFGLAYDVTGDGRTAIKGNVGMYVSSGGPNFVQTYNPSFIATDTRTWDDLNGDDIAQENEIGPGSANFGLLNNRNPDPNIKRPYQSLWNVGIQRELRPGLSVGMSYNERHVYKESWTDNLLIQPSDYILLTVPDPRGNGQTLPVYNLPRDKFGLVDELDTHSDENWRYYRGVDLTANVRLQRGITVNGGISTGHSISNECQVEEQNSLRFCDQSQYDIPFQTNYKVSFTIPLPYGVWFAGVAKSLPGSERSITYRVTRSQLPTLTAASVNVRLNEPGTEFQDRVNQLDFTVSRSFRQGNLNVRPEVAFFNMLNANPVLSQNNAYGASLGRVNTVLNPRLVRLGLVVDF